MPNDLKGPGKKMWPHNIDEAIAELEVLLQDADPKVAHLLEEIKTILADLLGAAKQKDVPLKNGLLPPEVIPPLNHSHLPDLSGKYQVVEDKDIPGGFV